MKQYTYPVVLYYDLENELFTVAVHDLELYLTAETVEDAFLDAKEHVKIFFDFANEMNETPPQSAKYLDIYFENTDTDNIVLLVDVKG